jgi:serine/threonine-protein kinase
VEGVNLERCNDALGPLAPAQVAALVTGVGRGLDAAYQQGVCHGRLTLRKLILGRLQNGRVGVTIVGFGAALLVQPSTDTTGATSPIDVSTATTVAPEMLTGASIVDQRADVYSLAAIVFELLAGRPVFQDDNAIRLLARKVATDAPRLREVARVPVAPKFEEIVARGLSRDPALRPRSAGELVFELRRSADVGGPSSRALEDCLADTLESMRAEDGGGANTGKFEPV